MERSSGGRGRARLTEDFARGVGMLRFKARIGAAAFRRLMLGLVIGWAGIALGYVAFTQPAETVPAALRWSVARLIDGVGLGLSQRLGQTVETDHGPERWSFATIRHDPWHSAQFTRLFEAAITGALIGVMVIPLVGIASVLTTARVGRRAGAAHRLRGRELTSDRDLARRLQRAGAASDLAIGRVPLVQNAETGHLLLLGAPGAGKTQAIIHLLERIRDRGEAAIVYDIKGGLFGQFHDSACGDLILNPLDQRGASWSPWAEITTRADCTRLAESLIPLGSEREPYWGVAARMLFAACLERLRQDPEHSVERLLDLLLTMPRAQMRQILAGTPAAASSAPAWCSGCRARRSWKHPRPMGGRAQGRCSAHAIRKPSSGWLSPRASAGRPRFLAKSSRKRRELLAEPPCEITRVTSRRVIGPDKAPPGHRCS